MNPPIDQFHNVAPGDLLTSLMFQLITELKWETHDTERTEAFFNKTAHPYYYSNGRGVRPVFWQPSPRALDYLWGLVEQLTGHRYEACFINHYHNNSGNLGWHADDSISIDAKRPVSVLSLGASRTTWVRPTDAPDHVTPHLQHHGSLFVMRAGMQADWQHAVLPEDQPAGPRLSLVFRGLSGYRKD